MVDLVGWLVRVVYCRMYSYCVFSLLLVLLFTNSKKKIGRVVERFCVRMYMGYVHLQVLRVVNAYMDFVKYLV